MTNGDVDADVFDVFADDFLRLIASEPPRDDDDDEDPELCRVAMSFRPSVECARLVVWVIE